MSKNLLLFVAIISLLFVSDLSSAQSPIPPALGTASNFALFTASGLVTNIGVSTIVGDIGTNEESFDGFATVVLAGTTYNPGAVTAAAATDVNTAYNDLKGRTYNSLIVTPLNTVNMNLTPKIYYQGGAATLNGNLTLDGGGNSSSVFIIQINGALSTSTGSRIILQNGASFSNVYWQVNGAVELGTNSFFSGTIIAAGAITMKQGANFTGRALSTGGAININTNAISNISTALPVTLISFTAKKGENQTATLNWATTAETNSDRFKIEHSFNGKSWEALATVDAKGESNVLTSYQYSDTKPNKGTNLYRLKMIDQDATFAYSRIQSVEIGAANARTVLYPNPAVDKLTLDVDDIDQIERIQLNNILGKVVYDQSKTMASVMPANVDMTNLSSGMYIVRVTRSNGAVAMIKVLKQ